MTHVQFEACAMKIRGRVIEASSANRKCRITRNIPILASQICDAETEGCCATLRSFDPLVARTRKCS